jgi:hypothetical protein
MRPLVAAFALSLLMMPALARSASPAGWFLAGNDPTSYVNAIDPNVKHEGTPSARLASVAPSKGFGTMMQDFDASDYAGKRVRLSGWVKAEKVASWAGLWMRVDDGSSPVKTLAFDNMQSRAIKGTLGWARYDVVLDVAPEAKSISMGILLAGQGSVWVSDMKVEVVPNTVPVTGQPAPTQNRKPANLDFAH